MSNWIIYPPIIAFLAAWWWSYAELNHYYDEELQDVGWERIQLVTIMAVAWFIAIPYYLSVVRPKLEANRRK